jgi:hypothetical protein
MGDGYGGRNITRCEDKLRGETGASSEGKGDEQRLCVPRHQQNLISPTYYWRFFPHCTGHALPCSVHRYIFCSIGLHPPLNCMMAD